MKVLKYLGLAVVFAWFFVGGISHFTRTEFFLAIMPPYIPFHTAAVYVSGVFELIGAIAIWPPRTRSAAGWGLMALTLLVTPANVHMWVHPELYPDVSEAFLSGRLVVQVLLLALIWWSTRPMDAKALPAVVTT
jgi:uncharacterized membrane protein